MSTSKYILSLLGGLLLLKSCFLFCTQWIPLGSKLNSPPKKWNQSIRLFHYKRILFLNCFDLVQSLTNLVDYFENAFLWTHTTLLKMAFPMKDNGKNRDISATDHA